MRRETVFLPLWLFLGSIYRLVDEPCGLSGIQIFPLRENVERPQSPTASKSFKVVECFPRSWGAALVPWPAASFSQLI